MTINRRDALKLGGLTILGSAALGVPLGRGAQTKGAASRLSVANFPRRYAAVIAKAPPATPRMIDGVAHYDFTIRREPAAQVLTGSLTTPVFGYDGVFPGPRVELDRGTRAVVRVRNQLPAVGPFGSPARTSTHLHGSASLPEYDGYANDTTAVGEYKDYQYPNFQPARTLWYHDHGVHWTSQQAYGGLAAMYLIHDKDEQTLLPKGEFDIPLAVNDAIFGADGQLLFDDNLHSGLWGDVILVNGRPWPVMKVQRRTYRFRVLNSSISRSYTWRLSNGMPLQVVATDGGLMPQGVAVTSMRHSGAERYEIVIDFSKVPATTKRIELLNDSNKNNVDYDFTGKVMAFDLLDGPVTTTRSNYDHPSVQEPDPTWNRDYHNFPLVRSEVMDLPLTGDYKRRHFRLKRDDLTQEWTIDSTSWGEVEDSNFTKVLAAPAIGAVEVWEFENSSGGWFHPLHIHLVDFRIIKRTGGVGRVLPHEQGPKDVVYVGEGETVHLLVKFNKPGGDPDFQGGRYMVHCHNLPHEDHDMMSQFSIGAISYSGYDPHHPIDGARPSVLSAPAPPVIGTAAPSNASALVRWSPPVDDGGWAITGYLVRAFASTVLVRTQAVTGDVASVVVTGLANTTAYTFDVAAINAAGTGAASDRSTAVTPRTEFIAPVVTARTPAAGARSVSQTSNVTMTFSEPVTGVTSGTFVLRLGTAVVPAAVTYNATTRVATLDPTVTLQADRVYGVSFSGIRDTAGNLLAPSPWSFTTGPAPTMTATTPASGATAVRRNNNVTATFSEAITGFNTTTVRITRVSTGAVVPSTVAFNPTTRVLTINPGATLAASAQYRVTITGGTAAVRDLAGNPLVTRTWVFTTGTAL